MHDLVAVYIYDKIQGHTGFLTWGRLFHPVYDTELLECVKLGAKAYDIQNIEKIQLLDNLGGLASYPYFYESYALLLDEKIPYGTGYSLWVRRKRKLLRQGKDIFFVGFKKENR